MAWSLGYCVYCTALALSTEILRPGGAHKQGGPYEGDGSGVHCGCNNCLHHVFVVVRGGTHSACLTHDAKTDSLCLKG